MQSAGGQYIGQSVPDRDNQVLRGRNNVLHEGHIQIEILVVQMPDHMILYEAAQLGQVQDVACFRVRLTGNGYIQRIIVSVPVGAVARAKSRLIPRAGPLIIV